MFCMLVCFTTHWLSCFFFLISYDEDDGWVASMDLLDKGLYEKYVTSFYWAIMTMYVELNRLPMGSSASQEDRRVDAGRWWVTATSIQPQHTSESSPSLQ
jgi:hypothetical protein